MTYGSPAGQMALVRDEAYALLPARATVSESILALISERVPVETFVMVAESLIAVRSELEQLSETTVPLPDDVEARLVEHEAMRDALNAAPEEWKPRLRELFVGAQQPGLSSGLDAGRVPVFPGVLEGLAAVMEDLRRAALADPGVAAALRQVDGW